MDKYFAVRQTSSEESGGNVTGMCQAFKLKIPQRRRLLEGRKKQTTVHTYEQAN